MVSVITEFGDVVKKNGFTTNLLYPYPLSVKLDLLKKIYYI
jgi:hypothetical protein